MDTDDRDTLMGTLRAYGAALAALLATHPEPMRLRPAFDQLAARAAEPHPAYHATIDTLRKAIPPH